MSGAPPGGRGHVPIEHTADCGIEAWAPDAAGLFEECASGMFETMYGPGTKDRDLTVEVTAAAETMEELLVAWLSELLSAAEIDGIAPSEFAVDSIEEGEVRGRARGGSADEVDLVGPPIKAVTYHGIEVGHDPGWRARVIFDV